MARLVSGLSRGGDERRQAVDPVYELAVRQRDEQGEDGAQVHDEQRPHDRLVPQHQQGQSGDAGDQQQRNEPIAKTRLFEIAQGGVATS